MLFSKKKEKRSTAGLGKLLRQHERLKDKRNPMFERNRFTKFLAYFMVAYYAACMIFLGVVLPLPMSEVYHGVAGFHVLDAWFFILLIADFWMRFIVQETPANQTRPYSLLPISRRYLMHRFLRRAGLTWGNLFWGFFLVPFALMSVMPAMNLWAAVGWLLGWWLLIVANSYAYLCIRALSTRHLAWIALPLLLHAGIVLLAILPDHNYLDAPFTLFMHAFAQWQWWPFALAVALIGIAFWVNVKVQGSILYDEVGNVEDVSPKHTTQMNFLNRYGIVGEYLKLELKMRMRNSVIRNQTLVLLGVMLLLSGVLYFTDLYDEEIMTSYICLYDYLVPGMGGLITIMCYEGAYMDGLMSRRESILLLLTAKFYFNVIILLFPFLLLIPIVIAGKISMWMSLGYLLFTVGVVYPLMFQMVAYNKETLPLNTKLTGRTGTSAQNIVSLTVMGAPLIIERLSTTFLGEPWGYILLCSMGLVGIATHRYWMRFTYRRFMARRYANMEGFRATRKA